jgi:hypothetical protein
MPSFLFLASNILFPAVNMGADCEIKSKSKIKRPAKNSQSSRASFSPDFFAAEFSSQP